MHAALRGEDAAHAVHVGDHRVERERLVRRQAGVHRLEREDAPNPLVPEERADLAFELAEPAHAHEPKCRRERTDEIGDRVDVAVDERRHLDSVQLVEPGAEALEPGGIVGPGECADLLDHALTFVPHVELAAVLVAGAVHRVDRFERDVVGHLPTYRGERLLQQLGHREHRRPVVERVAERVVDKAGPATGPGAAFEHGDVVTGPDEVGGGRQSTEPGTDDDDPHPRSIVIQDRSISGRATPRSGPAR